MAHSADQSTDDDDLPTAYAYFCNGELYVFDDEGRPVPAVLIDGKIYRAGDEPQEARH